MDVAPPRVGFHYGLFLDGTQVGNFGKLAVESGFELDPRPDQSGKRLPTRLKWPEVELTRFLGQDRTLWDWQRQVVQDGESARRAAEIVVYDQTHSPVARFALDNAFPAVIELTPSGDLLLETVQLTGDELRRTQ
jgi:phage tail-like protein